MVQDVAFGLFVHGTTLAVVIAAPIFATCWNYTGLPKSSNDSQDLSILLRNAWLQTLLNWRGQRDATHEHATGTANILFQNLACMPALQPLSKQNHHSHVRSEAGQRTQKKLGNRWEWESHDEHATAHPATSAPWAISATTPKNANCDPHWLEEAVFTEGLRRA